MPRGRPDVAAQPSAAEMSLRSGGERRGAIPQSCRSVTSMGDPQVDESVVSAETPPAWTGSRRGHHFQALHAESEWVELRGASMSCPSGKGGMAPGRPSGRGQTLTPSSDSFCSLWRFPCWTSNLLKPVTLYASSLWDRPVSLCLFTLVSQAHGRRGHCPGWTLPRAHHPWSV